MRKRKQWISIMAGILAVILILSLIAGVLPSLVNAEESSSEIKNQIEVLEEEKAEIDAKIAELESQRSENLDEMEAIVLEKNIIDQEIFMLHEQVANLNDQISAYSLLIADKQDELDSAEKRLADLNEKNKERIRAMEEDGNISYWSVLFQANDFADLLDRLNMIEEIAASDQRRLKEMSEAAEVVSNAKAELEGEKASLEENKAELKASQEELEAKRTEADALLADLLATGAEYEALLDQAEQEVEDLLNKIDEREDAYDEAKDREYQQWLATSVPPTTKPPATSSGGGTAGSGNEVAGVTWLIPCDYTRFSSPFGYRIHPVYGDWRFHSGVDLAAPSGTPIIASRSGRVDIATYDWSAGYYVVLDHFDGYETKYLHMTHYIVSEGDYVTAGQVIGYVGSTGTSTGAHLHFGVYKNGTAVNPADYINIS